MTVFVIMEETTDIKRFDGLPRPEKFPVYTYAYEVESETWYRSHRGASPRGAGIDWVALDPKNPMEGVPKHIRAAVLILGG